MELIFRNGGGDIVLDCQESLSLRRVQCEMWEFLKSCIEFSVGGEGGENFN